MAELAPVNEEVKDPNPLVRCVGIWCAQDCNTSSLHVATFLDLTVKTRDDALMVLT